MCVDAHCSKFPPAGSYLRVDQYSAAVPGDQQRLVTSILYNIFRHDEPYVRKALAKAAHGRGRTLPDRYEVAVHHTCMELAQTLPLWAVIDSFHLGLLGQFIMHCDTSQEPLWKSVAQELDIAARIFETQIRSLNFLRNCVAHHARLWMRPTVDSPQEPRLFRRRVREAHRKSMYWAILNLATFLPKSERHEFADRVDGLIRSFDLHQHDITNVHEVG